MKRQRFGGHRTRRRLRIGLGRRAGVSLVELLVVIAVVAILSGVVLSRMQPNIREGLLGTARAVAADLDRARELAVASGSNYRVTFDLRANAYWLEHTGANPLLDTLPPSPFGDPDDPPTRWTQRLARLPQLGPPVRLYDVRTASGGVATAKTVEFGPLGETARSEPTVLWLCAGAGSARRYLSVSVHPVTGLTSIGGFQASPP